MNLVTNFDDSRNHFAVLRTLAAGADKVIVVSPYLSPDLARILAKLSIAGLREFRLITTLERFSVTQFHTLHALESLRTYFRDVRPDVEWTVEIAAGLHGKVYLFKQDAVSFAALVSSANFTESGLRRNSEWGVAFRDPALLDDIESSLDRLVLKKLTGPTIDSLIKRRDEYLALYPGSTDEGTALDLAALVSTDGSTGVQQRTIWLKPSGVSDNPVVEGDPYDDLETDLHFSTI